MAGAFLTDTLRAQAQAELRGQMLQDQIAKQVARQIVGQVAQQEVADSINRLGSRGRALSQAAGQSMRRDVGKTQLEMKKDLAQTQKTMNLITGVASAAGALGSHFALQEEEKPEAKKFSTPETELQAMDFEKLFTEGQDADIIPERYQMASMLDAQAPDEFIAPPPTNLQMPSSGALNPGQYKRAGNFMSDMEKEELERQLKAAQGGINF